MFQIGANGTISGIPYNFSTFSFIDNVSLNHDAGHWYLHWFVPKFRNSNKYSYINRRRRLFERKVLVNIPYLDPVYYDEFTLTVTEEDGLSAEDDLGSYSFDFNVETFGTEKQTRTGVFVRLDRSQYQVSSY